MPALSMSALLAFLKDRVHNRVKPIWILLGLVATVVSIATVLFALHYSTALAEIIIDGNIVETDWNTLDTNAGGPTTSSFGAGNEVNGLSAKIDSNYLYIALAGDVQVNNRILILIDSKPGGYPTTDFGRGGGPPLGIANLNPFITFDIDFFADYILAIGNNGTGSYEWNLFTLEGTFAGGGGSNAFLGNQNDPDLGASPANGSLTQGFESRLEYNSTGAGVDLAFDNEIIQFFVLLDTDQALPGNTYSTVSNQTLSPASSSQTNSFGSGPLNFNSLTPNPVPFYNLLVINEVDYVQPGADDREFVEIKNITQRTINLDPYRLDFATGSGAASVYRQIDLPNFNLAPGDYYVVCGIPANVPNCDLDATPDTDLLDNALPSAVGLFYQSAVDPVDTVSYGGNTASPFTEGSGVVADDDTVPGLGISRLPDGVDTNVNVMDFSRHCVTPGAVNTPQATNCAGFTTGTVKIIKDTAPDGPQDFAFSTTGGLVPATFNLDDDADVTLSNTQTFNNVAAGAYSVSEAAVAGYNATISCVDPDSGTTTAGGTANIDLDPGETVTCTFTNTQLGTIEIIKDTVPDGPQDFAFTTTGGLLPANFVLDDDADGTLPNTQTFNNVAAGSYTVSETAVFGYSTALRCVDPDGGTITAGSTAIIDLDPGETATCTFTNTQLGTIQIIKDTVPDGPQDFSFTTTGGLVPATFALDDDADVTLPNKQTFNVTAGVYSVSETDVAGYSTTLSCVDPDAGTTTAGSTATIDLDPGETVTCTFTNTFINTVQPGDCNADQKVDAGDLSALGLEIFDGDDSCFPPGWAGGGFPGTAGCDANQDGCVDAGDLSCTVLIIFNRPCGEAIAAGEVASPVLSIAETIPAPASSQVGVPITLNSNGNQISSMVFSIDYDETLLSFDPSDKDGDGMPDAVQMTVPGQFNTSVKWDRNDHDGELDVVIFDAAPPLQTLSSGAIMTVTLSTGDDAAGTTAIVGFSQDPVLVFGSTKGQSILVTGEAGSIQIGPLADTDSRTENQVFLPAMTR